MPKRHRNRRRTMSGGLFGIGESSSYTNSYSPSTSSSSVGSWFSNAWDKTKKAVGMSDNSTLSYPTSNSSYGGKTKRRRHSMKGGYTSTTGLAAHAAPFSGPSAKPHVWLGGKKTRRSGKHRHSKSCKHRKH